MRFAVKTRPEHVPWSWLLDVWQAADGVPLFESIWNWDHFYPLTGDLDGPNLEGWTSLAALAQATTRIRVGCQVTGMLYRHPAVLANMAATVDVISAGRLDLGLGAGWNQHECDAYGIRLPPLRERFDVLDEGLQVVVGLLSNESTDFVGEHFSLTAARCEPKPVQRPHPPITIGGRGPRRTLRAVAQWAQQWNAICQSPQQWAGLKAVLVQHCATLGRDPAEITCSVNVIVTGTDRAALDHAAATAATFAAAGADLAVMNLPHGAPITLLERLADRLVPLTR